MSLSFKDSCILVVGGAGFVGSNLCHTLIKYSPKRIIVVDNLLSSDISNVSQHPSIDFVYGSITKNKILEILPEDLNFVFHLSTYHGNQSSIADPLADHENNTVTSLKLFEKLKGFRFLNRVVYSAAGCAVAEKTYDSAVETLEDAPVSLYHDSPYSISKIVGELYGNYYFKQYGLPFVKARFQNVYGPREILGAGRWRGTVHTVWRNVIPTFIYKALQGIPLPLEKGGDVSRDFIYVNDIVDGLIRCAQLGTPGEIYNLASGVETTILELADMIKETTGSSASHEILPARNWDQSGRRFGSTEKSKRELGFIAKTSLVDGISMTTNWTQENIEKINKCIDNHTYFLNMIKDGRR